MDKEKDIKNEDIQSDTEGKADDHTLEAQPEEVCEEAEKRDADTEEEPLKEETKEEAEEPLEKEAEEDPEKEKDLPQKETAKEEPEEELVLEEAEELEPELEVSDSEEVEDEDILILEDEEEEGEVDEDVEARRKKRKKIAIRILIGIAVVIVSAYCGFAYYFSGHFYFQTTINGVDQSMKSVAQVEAYMEQQVKDYVLTLKEADGSTEQITGTEISMTYEKGKELLSCVKSQNPFLWPMGLWKAQEFTADIGVTYNEEKLAEKIAGLNCMKEENQVAPVSAVPEYNGTEYVVKPEETGSQIDQEVFETKIREYLNGFLPELDLTEEECYVKAKFLQDSPEVIAACEQMNQYLTASVTYKMGSQKEVVDKAKIQEWLYTQDTMKVAFSEKKMKAYISELAKKYDTYQTERTFTSASGNTVKVSGGDYGWKIDQNTEYKKLLSNLQKCESVEREPAYSKKAASHDGNEWGNTYVEVDLSGQRVYLVVNGSVVLNTPCVTGNVNKGWYTPQGVYSIKYCTRNATLRGPRKSDGSYEWESPVSFWMPFNGGIGLHDASWQTSFGNPQGYLSTGSRGCVNLKYDAAQTIYNNVSAGTPVICHF